MRTFCVVVNAPLVRVCHAGEKHGARSKERIANGEWRIANSQELRAKGKEQGAGSKEQRAESEWRIADSEEQGVRSKA